MASELLIKERLSYFSSEEVITAELRFKTHRVMPKYLEQDILSFPPYPDVDCSDICWNDTTLPRSLARALNGFVFLVTLAKNYLETNDTIGFNRAHLLIKDFAEQNPAYIVEKGSMVFHDETTALRASSLIIFLATSLEFSTPAQIEVLCNEILKTVELLSQEHFFVGNSNHGMFQSVSLLKGALIFNHPESNNWIALAEKRLNEYFLSAFTSDGIHNEHSPMYHAVVLRYLDEYINLLKMYDLEIPPQMEELSAKAHEYPKHYTRHDRKAFLMGDSTISTMINLPMPPNNGKSFTPFENTGYAFFEDSELKLNACFSACFQHYYHKHNDDLQFIMYFDGDVLIDAGGPGYEYENPYVEYGRSYHAHNTLCVDGASFHRRNRDYENVNMTQTNNTPEYATATGYNKRYPDVVHERTVNYFWDNNLFEIIDNVTSDNTHHYCFSWHFDSALNLEIQTNSINVYRNEKLIATMTITADNDENFIIVEATGQDTPHIQGYRFRVVTTPEPTPTIEVIFEKCSNVKMTTKIQLFN